MTTHEILPELFFIQRGYLSGNHFALRASEPVLIDTAYLSESAKTLSLLAARGCDWRRTARIINTHCHCDHIGANRLIQEASGCVAAMHGVGRRQINEDDRRGTWSAYFDQEAPRFECAESLEDGEEFMVGGHAFIAVHAPGHARDQLALYNPSRKLLISSDALWESDMAALVTAIEGEDAPSVWLSSIEKLAKLDVREVYPGHGRPFRDFDGALKKAEARLLRFRDEPKLAADDLLRKIAVYTLLMRGSVAVSEFFALLMGSEWFPATVDAHFEGEYARKYTETIERLVERKAVGVVQSRFLPQVPA